MSLFSGKQQFVGISQPLHGNCTSTQRYPIWRLEEPFYPVIFLNIDDFNEFCEKF